MASCESLMQTLDTYSSGPNNCVVLNKRVGWIFCSPLAGQNSCLWKIFKSYYVKNRMWAGFFLWINRPVEMFIKASRVCTSASTSNTVSATFATSGA